MDTMASLSKWWKEAAACAAVSLTLLHLQVYNNGGTINVVPIYVYVFQQRPHSTKTNAMPKESHSTRCYWPPDRDLRGGTF
jgi:hypothetical protein